MTLYTVYIMTQYYCNICNRLKYIMSDKISRYNIIIKLLLQKFIIL